MLKETSQAEGLACALLCMNSGHNGCHDVLDARSSTSFGSQARPMGTALQRQDRAETLRLLLLPVALRGHRTAATSPAGVSFQTTAPKLSSSQISWGSARDQTVRWTGLRNSDPQLSPIPLSQNAWDEPHQDIAERHTVDTHPGGPGRLLPQRKARSRHAPVAGFHLRM